MSHLFTVFLIQCLCLASISAVELPVATVEGSPREIGSQVGKRFADRIQAYLGESQALARAVAYADSDGLQAFRAMEAAVGEAYPDAVDEVSGMADALGVNRTVMMVLQMVPELLSLADGRGPALQARAPVPRGGGKACSDVMVLASGGWSLSHNEDASPQIAPGAYLVNATVHGRAGGPPTRYLALCYPGTLCGNAFAWLPSITTAITCNAVFPNETRTAGLPRNFITHATLGASSVEDALERSLAAPRAYGFSVNVANATDMFNVEVSPDAHAVVHADPVRGFLEHFNMYAHLVPPCGQLDDPSSRHRRAAAAKHGTPRTVQDALGILGDTSDPAFPVFRNATAPDDCATVATAAFDFSARRVRVFGANPASASPFLEFSM